MPMTYGQLDTGPRLVRMGVAEMIRPNKMNAERLQAALTRLLASPGVSQKCDEYARKFRDDRPIEDTCQILEDFMTSGQV